MSQRPSLACRTPEDLSVVALKFEAQLRFDCVRQISFMSGLTADQIVLAAETLYQYVISGRLPAKQKEDAP